MRQRWLHCGKSWGAPRLVINQPTVWDRIHGLGNLQRSFSFFPAPPRGYTHFSLATPSFIAISVEVTITAAARLTVLKAFINSGSVSSQQQRPGLSKPQPDATYKVCKSSCSFLIQTQFPPCWRVACHDSRNVDSERQPWQIRRTEPPILRRSLGDFAVDVLEMHSHTRDRHVLVRRWSAYRQGLMWCQGMLTTDVRRDS